MQLLNQIQKNLQASDSFAGKALQESIDFARQAAEPDCEVSLVIAHLALIVGEFRKSIARMTSESEGKLAAINAGK